MSWKKKFVSCALVLGLIPLMGQTACPPGIDPVPDPIPDSGLSCWDLNADGTCDPEEDANGDGTCDAADCQGEQGPKGDKGDKGEKGDQGDSGQDGAKGDPGLSCWDLNENGVRDLPDEDRDGDGDVDVDDCCSSGGTGGDCADCDSRFVNENQSNSISTEMIQDDAVTQQKIDASGASNGKVLKTDGNDIYWGTDETGGGGPVIEFGEAESTIQLTSSWQTINSNVIDVPTSGKIHVVANASFGFNDVGRSLYLGISLTDGGSPANIATMLHTVDYSMLCGTTQYVTSVSPGTHTFYFVAKQQIGSGDTTAAKRQISIAFFPD